MVKLFYFEYGEEWYAAETADAAFNYAKEYHKEDEFTVDDFEELTDDELKTLVFKAEEGGEYVFGQVLDQMIEDDHEFPCLFASAQ